MPSRHTVSTAHRNENGEQVTEKTIERYDGSVVTFSGPAGGSYEYDGDGDSPEWAVEALYEHVDEGEIVHERPGEGDDGR